MFEDKLGKKDWCSLVCQHVCTAEVLSDHPLSDGLWGQESAVATHPPIPWAARGQLGPPFHELQLRREILISLQDSKRDISWVVYHGPEKHELAPAKETGKAGRRTWRIYDPGLPQGLCKELQSEPDTDRDTTTEFLSSFLARPSAKPFGILAESQSSIAF